MSYIRRRQDRHTGPRPRGSADDRFSATRRPELPNQHARHGSNGRTNRGWLRIDRGGALTIDRRGAVKWMTENAITIAALEEPVTGRRVGQCVAFDQADGWFIVLAKLTRECYVRPLATFREVGKPRRFSRLDVLFKLLHDTLGYNGVIHSRAGFMKRLGPL
jgi:hypothetical protein